MIWQHLDKYRDHGLLVLRLGIGSMFLFHGVPKLMGGPAVWKKLGGAMAYFGIKFAPTFFGFMAAFAEAIGGCCFILGLFYRPACILLGITMIVAANFHLGKGDGLKGASHAIELGIIFWSMILIGPGAYSMDQKFRIARR